MCGAAARACRDEAYDSRGQLWRVGRRALVQYCDAVVPWCRFKVWYDVNNGGYGQSQRRRFGQRGRPWPGHRLLARPRAASAPALSRDQPDRPDVRKAQRVGAAVDATGFGMAIDARMHLHASAGPAATPMRAVMRC